MSPRLPARAGAGFFLRASAGPKSAKLTQLEQGSNDILATLASPKNRP